MHHLNFCFNRGIIANLGPVEFELLINNEVVRNFTMSNHEKTNVHNCANWFYNLEGQSESPTPPYSPQHYENPKVIFSDVDSHASGAHHIVPPVEFGTAIHALQSEVDFIKGEVNSLRVDLLRFMDVVNEQFDHVFQQVHSLKCSLGQK